MCFSKIEPQLLPEQERRIIYKSFRGINCTTATGVQRLSMRQMVLLYYASEGKTRREFAELMECKVTSIISIQIPSVKT